MGSISKFTWSGLENRTQWAVRCCPSTLPNPPRVLRWDSRLYWAHAWAISSHSPRNFSFTKAQPFFRDVNAPGKNPKYHRISSTTTTCTTVSMSISSHRYQFLGHLGDLQKALKLIKWPSLPDDDGIHVLQTSYRAVLMVTSSTIMQVVRFHLQ